MRYFCWEPSLCGYNLMMVIMFPRRVPVEMKRWSVGGGSGGGILCGLFLFAQILAQLKKNYGVNDGKWYIYVGLVPGASGLIFYFKKTYQRWNIQQLKASCNLVNLQLVPILLTTTLIVTIFELTFNGQIKSFRYSISIPTPLVCDTF